MKKNLFLMLCVFGFSLGFAQDKIYKNNEVDVIAAPYEGMSAFYQTIAKEIDIVNLEKLPNKKVDFRVFFIVEKDGSFTDFNTEGISFGRANEVIAALKKMPKWKPAVYNSENVRSQMIIPISLIGSKPKR
ncbi:energy transducer TonB [Paenimyroides aestuarii]|uniref:TonB C-terminal domain-containing protein n=1 Tax=Paenimyroides aestuarii TaxID=2968490 RepID=A0ABY5NTJ8_9FLAO|nr:hypothetical protein [Paenimyroides aestuarii]UUV21894.1 hypothetical protein NPX36_02240 [Paenimyroides aestuarii]